MSGRGEGAAGSRQPRGGEVRASEPVLSSLANLSSSQEPKREPGARAPGCWPVAAVGQQLPCLLSQGTLLPRPLSPEDPCSSPELFPKASSIRPQNPLQVRAGVGGPAFGEGRCGGG